MTKYDAMIIELKKAIMTDGHYLIDIVEAAATQQARLEMLMDKYGLTEAEAIHHEGVEPRRRPDYRKQIARAKARA